MTDQIDAGRRLFGGPCRFLLGVARLDQLPEVKGVEIAFAGRSNVGKSSLINAVTGMRDLARASNTPGRTRELNFFDVNGQLTLVDMPGYGYARASKTAIDNWTRLIFDYLRGRSSLRRVYVLIDSRHGVKDNDKEALDVLDQAAVSYQIVLTKCDQPKKSALEAIKAETERAIAKRPAAHPEVMLTASRSGLGIQELRAAIADLL